jgi:Raf kinase inhibitor-like YbhB/YbcL family protein
MACLGFAIGEGSHMSEKMMPRRFILAQAGRMAAGAAAAALLPRAASARVTLKAEDHEFTLTSGAFADGTDIPSRFTCDGEDISPPLAWSRAPMPTSSFALVCYDPDAPDRTFYHWAVFDIPGNRTDLHEAFPHGAVAEGARQAINDFGQKRYRGPCPPPGHGVHHYHFELFALPVTQLGLPVGATCLDVFLAVRDRALARATLIGVYSR